MTATAETTAQIINKKGLHARAAAKFVKTVAAFSAKVTVVKKGDINAADSEAIDGGDILDLLMLGADPTSKLYITAEGEQAQEVINALQQLIDDKFGEGE